MMKALHIFLQKDIFCGKKGFSGFLTLALCFYSFYSFAQRPVITTLSKTKGSVNEIITISGEGFGSKDQLQLRFGAALAKITESNSTTIKAEVPAGASFDNITVLNKTGGLSASSPVPFSPAFGGGGFAADKLSAAGSFPANPGIYDLQLHDLDHDGLPEVISTNTVSNTISVYRNNSTIDNISFTKTDWSPGGLTRSLVVQDVDGDGISDLVFNGFNTTTNKVYILKTLISAGALSFQEITPLTLSTTGDGQIALSDLNRDGKPDLIVTQNDAFVYVHLNTSTPGAVSFGSTAQKFSLPSGSAVYGLEVADLDNDQKPEIIVAGNFNRNIYILPNTTTSASIQFGTPVIISSSGSGFNLMVGDLDGDNKPDIALNFPTNGYLGIWLNKSTGSGNISFGDITSFTTELWSWGLQMADIDGDGLTEIMLSQRNSATLSIFKNNSTPGNALFSLVSVTSLQNNWYLRAADVNGDGKTDIVYTGKHSTAPNLHVLKNNICFRAGLNQSGSHEFCEGTPFRLETVQGAGLTYTWKKDNAAIAGMNSYNLEVTESGKYTVSISELNGCSSTSSEVVVKFVPGAAVQTPVFAPITPVCEGGTLILKTDAVAGASYNWEGPNDFSETTTTPSISIENVNLDHRGSYTLKLTAGPCSSPVATQNAEVTAASVPVISFNGNTTVCADEPVSLSAEGSFQNYQWLKDGKPVNGATGASFQAEASGSYTLRVSNATGCESVSEPVVLMRGNAPQSLFQVPEMVCVNQAVEFVNKTTATINETLIYSWDFGDGNTSVAESPVHIYTTAGEGTYTVKLRVRYHNSTCNDQYSQTIRVKESTDEVSLNTPEGTSFCPGTGIPLEISGDAADATWSDGTTGLQTRVSEAGTYRVDVMTHSGCILSRSVTIEQKAVPAIEVSTDKTIIKAGEAAQLSASGGISYEWSPAEGLNNPSVANPMARPSETTTYTVMVTNGEGCTTEKEITIETDHTIYLEANKFFIPSLESFWKVSYIEYHPNLKLYILNRFGKIVHTAQPYLNHWDGRSGGTLLDEGVYYYVFKDAEGKAVKTGTITLIH